ncbi:MAG: hypothetical protein ACI37R_06545 [Candidatus Avigastranaerophilus sp.]
MRNESVDYSNLRKQVSELYISVLTKRLSVREALNAFPQDCDDKTIIAAWHALCHLEADEDIRAKDEMYKKEQDEYIDYIAYTLDKGEELPENIVNAYIPYHENALVADSTKLKGIIRNIKKFLC